MRVEESLELSMAEFDLHHFSEPLRAVSDDAKHTVGIRSRQARDCGSLSCPSSAVVSDAVDVEDVTWQSTLASCCL